MFFHGNKDYANAPPCYVIRTQTFLFATTYQSTWRHITVDFNLQPERSKNPTSRNIRGIFCGAIACGQSVYKRTINMDRTGQDKSLWYAGNSLLVAIPTRAGWLAGYLIADSLAIRNINWRTQNRVKECNGLNYTEQNTCDINIHGRGQATETMQDHMLPINWTYITNCFTASYCLRQPSTEW